MRRLLPRILLNAATVASLVLCLAAVALWVRSYQAQDMLNDWAPDDIRWTGVWTFCGCI